MNFSDKTAGERGFYGEDLEMMAGSSNRASSNLQYPYYHQHEFMEASPATTREAEEPNESELGLGSTAAAAVVEREHMFDKVVTPSDVGKLNRLVIPKQYAEKYFPLDSSANEKGLLLNFEDRNGKPWRFRYSYWNSSQSYVMTKGWSRFVKEKKLDAGDIVSFQRGAAESDKDRLFIDWRRRPGAPPPHHPFISSSSHPQQQQQQYLSFHNHHHNRPTQYLWNTNNNNNNNHLLFQQQLLHPNSNHPHFPHHHHHPHYGQFGYGSVVSNPVIYVRSSSIMPAVPQMGSGGGVSSGIGGAGGVEPMVFDSVPVVHGKAAAKRLRLFGVNMDCPVVSDSEEYNVLSSSAISPSAAQVSSSPIHHHPLQLRLYNDDSSSSSQVQQQHSQEHKGKGSSNSI